MTEGIPHPRASEIEAIAGGLVEGDNPDAVVTAGVYDAWDPYWSTAPVADSLKDGDFVPDIAVYVPLWWLKTREAAKRLG